MGFRRASSALTLSDSKLDCFAMFGENTAAHFRERFQLGLTTAAVDAYMERLIVASIGSNWTRLYDSFQYYSYVLHTERTLTLQTRSALSTGTCIVELAITHIYCMHLALSVTSLPCSRFCRRSTLLLMSRRYPGDAAGVSDDSVTNASSP